MKKLFTSCYGRSRSLPDGFPQVRTSRGIPDWWKPGRRIDALALAPQGHILSAAKANPKSNWQAMYRAQLDLLFKSGVLEKIVHQLPDNSVLMCFEANPCDCHRSILAAYLVEKGLATVSEYSPPPVQKPKPPENPQLSLL